MLSACLVGASVGFLWFNAFPASIFMGDTGSLGLGGAIGALAVMTQTELLLIILGGIFVIEALSVAVQVVSFKMFRRRVLLMAPVHHHFELLAWSETKIMLRFWIVAAVCADRLPLYQNSIGPRGPPRSAPRGSAPRRSSRSRPPTRASVRAHHQRPEARQRPVEVDPVGDLGARPRPRAGARGRAGRPGARPR